MSSGILPDASPPAASPSAHAKAGHAHVEHEFGAVAGGVRFHARADSDLSSSPPGVSVGARGVEKAASSARFSKAQWARLRTHVWHRRWLRQYFAPDGVLVREDAARGVSNEELYLDLIVVAAVASLAHELRHSFDGWPSVENFVLLFAALYSSWRTLMYLWNSYGTKGDFVDKVGVFLVQVCMAGIGLGAHSGFTNARGAVGVAAFLATAIPAVGYGIFSVMEPASTNKEAGHGNLFNAGVGYAVTFLLSGSPYLVAAFLGSARAAKNAYWVALVLTNFGLTGFFLLYQKLHQNRKRAVRNAVNIEGFVEKYGTFTLVVLGESLMALLFEGSELLADERVSVRRVFYAAFLGVLTIYSLMTLYFNVDNAQTRGYVHAIRHNRWAGFAWANIHFVYHMFVAGFLSTGIGLMMRDIGIAPGTSAVVAKDAAAKSKAEAAEHMLAAVVRAGGAETGVRVEQFTDKARWLFSVAWMGAILTSGVMGLMHKPGRRGKTKNQRIWLRAAITLGLGIGMPFSDIKASAYLLIFSLVTALFAISEFILIEMDRIGMLSGGPISSTKGASTVSPSPVDSVITDEKDSTGEQFLDDDESDEMDPAIDDEEVRKGGDIESGGLDESTEAARDQARARAQEHGCRFKAVGCKRKARRQCADQF